MTKSQQMRDSAVMISSTMPSAKYSCSGSPLILANGITAIDGLSGSGSTPTLPSPRWRGRGSEGTFRANSVDAQWPDDILELLLADIGEPSVDFATHLAECVL